MAIESLSVLLFVFIIITSSSTADRDILINDLLWIDYNFPIAAAATTDAINISSQCVSDTITQLTALRNAQSWAIQSQFNYRLIFTFNLNKTKNLIRPSSVRIVGFVDGQTD